MTDEEAEEVIRHAINYYSDPEERVAIHRFEKLITVVKLGTGHKDVEDGAGHDGRIH